MKQFSLDEYLKNPSRKVVTRDGRPVRIICMDAKYYNYPIIAFISLKDGTEVICPYTKNGVRFHVRQEGDDLFFAAEKHEGWINIFKSSNDIAFLGQSLIFESKEDAEKDGKGCDCYVATIKIEWEE